MGSTAKSITTALIGLAVTIATWVTTGTFNEAEIVTGILTVVTATGVYAIPNAHGAASWIQTHAKAFVPALVAAGVTVYTLVANGSFTGQAGLDVVLSLLAAAGVYAVPNAPVSTVGRRPRGA